MIANQTEGRRDRVGSILPVMALLLVCLCGFTALSVEVATVATVKVQCQNAADTAALAGARTLNGSPTSSTAQAQANAVIAASSNSAMGLNASGILAMVPFASSEVATTCGTYHYDSSSQSFYPTYSLASGENYNLVKASVSRAIRNSFFAVDAGGWSAPMATPTITATSVGAHRPRDVALLLDFSGSMNNESDLWNCESYLGPYFGQSNNPDPVIPTFGHYSSSSTAIVSTLTAPGGSSNLSEANGGMPAEEDSYTLSTRASGGSTPAFTSYPASYASAPLGDIPVNLSLTPSSAFATNVNDLFGGNFTTSYDPTYQKGVYSAFETGAVVTGLANLGQGYDFLYGYENFYHGAPTAPSGHGGPAGLLGFSGYTVGPKYWGKTFFTWPPDPRPAQDWRYQYFIDSSTGQGVTDNTTLWDPGTQSWSTPYNANQNYQINYKAILNWIQNIGPNVFPPTLRSGRKVYYTYIPTDVPAAAYDHNQPNSNIADPSVRFWKEYIDFCLGVFRDPFNNVQPPGSPACSYGPDYAWGTVQITAKPAGTPANSSYKLAYMNYADNPPRPRHRMWFGPMTMLQYIADTGISPGTLRDVSTFSTKLGIASVLSDIQVNHPNDLVSLVFYNRPQYAGEPLVGKFNGALSNLNRDYAGMTNSLWYPPNSGSSDVTPWDANGILTPSADFDFTYNTATQHGLMLAYNQFSTSPTLSGLTNAGGLGRVGAQKLVVLETDGMANVNTSTGFTSAAGYSSFYNVQPGQPISGSWYDENGLLQVAQSICNTASGAAGTANSVVSNPGLPGFATSNRPVSIQTIAFGIVFQIPTSTQSSAVNLLQEVSAIGGSTFPSSASDPANGYKWCIGDLNTRVQLLQQAFSKVLNDGNSVSIVQ